MNLAHCDRWWLAIQVRPHYEFITATILRSKGYEEFVPTYLSDRQWSDRRKAIRLPLFTGYVFCKFSTEICWPIVTTPGVIRIVGSGNGIARIEDAEIGAIQTITKQGIKAEPCRHVPLGSRVRVIHGALAGLEGIVTTHKNRQRLVLSLNLIQSSIVIDVDDCILALAGNADAHGSVTEPNEAPATLRPFVGAPAMTAGRDRSRWQTG